MATKSNAQPFMYTCPLGRYITTFQYRTDMFIDELTVFCSDGHSASRIHGQKGLTGNGPYILTSITGFKQLKAFKYVTYTGGEQILYTPENEILISGGDDCELSQDRGYYYDCDYYGTTCVNNQVAVGVKGTTSQLFEDGKNYPSWIEEYSLICGDRQPETSFPYNYLGCYADETGRALSKSFGTVSSISTCYSLAAAGKYRYFGLQYGGECRASNSYANATQFNICGTCGCTTKCSNNIDNCGSVGANALFLINKDVTTLVPTPAPSRMPIISDYYTNTVAFANIGNYRSIKMSEDGKYIVVAGEDSSKIFMSSDYGKTWAVKLEGKPITQSLAMSNDGSKIVVAEYSGSVYISADYGIKWIELTLPGLRYWNGIAMSLNGAKLVLITAYGYIYTSFDSGNNFVERSSMGALNWIDIAMNGDGTLIFAIAMKDADNSIIYRSFDSGLTWQIFTESVGYITYIAISTDGRTVAFVGTDLRVFISYDYGVSYYTRYIDDGVFDVGRVKYPSYSKKAIAMNGDGTKMAYVSSYGYLYISVDSGVNWFNNDRYCQKNWQSIAISENDNKMFAIANAYNDESSDKNYLYSFPSDYWTENIDMVTSVEVKSSLESNKFRCIKTNYNGEKVAVAIVEGKGNMSLSADFGNTWNETSIKAYWLAMSSSGTDLAAVEYGGSIYTSSDFGVTWIERTSAGMRDWSCIAMSADGVKLAAVVAPYYWGYGGSVHTSSDSGKSWIQRISLDFPLWCRYIAMSGDGKVLLAVIKVSDYDYLTSQTKSFIHSSLDFGVTWNVFNFNYGATPLKLPFSVSYITMSYDGRIVAYNHEQSDRVYMSYDYGETLSSLDYIGGSLGMSSDGKILMATSVTSGGVYTSSDYGITWHFESGSEVVYGWNSIAMSGDGTKVAATQCAGQSYGYYLGVIISDLSHFDLAFTDGPVLVMSIMAKSLTVSPSSVPSPPSVPTNTDNSSPSLQTSPIYNNLPDNNPTSMINSPSLTSTYTIVPTSSVTTAKDKSINSDLTFCDACSCPVTHRLENNVCKSCIYPMQSNKNKLVPDPTGSFLMYEPCSVVGIGIPYAGFVSIVTVVVMIFGNGLAAFVGDDVSQNTMIAVKFLTYALIPFLGYVTNLSYLLAAQFYNVSILSFFMILFIFAHLLFSMILYRKHALPKLYLLQMPSALVYTEYSPMTNTIVTGMLSIPFIFVNLPFLFPWFLFGSFLFLTHSFSLPFISTPWLSVWTGETIDKCMVVYYDGRSVSDIDMSILHKSLFIQIVFQSIPLFILQLINNMILGSWDHLSILCMVISVLNICVTSYRLCYLKIGK